MFDELEEIEDLDDLELDVVAVKGHFEEAKEQIARECKEEGLPDHGYTFDLRVENLKKDWPYRLLFDAEG